MMDELRVLLSREALINNISEFVRISNGHHRVMAVVKANAYGHGLVEILSIIRDTKIRKFGVFTLEEALKVKELIPDSMILIFQSLYNKELYEAIERGFDITIGSVDNLQNLKDIIKNTRSPPFIHLKVETGTNRQGITEPELNTVIQTLSEIRKIKLRGIYTHFANIEDTTDHSYAMFQLNRYRRFVSEFDKNGIKFEFRHTACSAAAILFPETHFDFVRIGISLYGHWPSKETLISANHLNIEKPNLLPVMSLRTKIIQIKNVRSSEYIGYGCTYKATRDMKIGILPIGYANGYRRVFSNSTYVIVKGRRAPVVGRVCMNIIMIDITDIPGVRVLDEVTLLGKDNGEMISAEDLAQIAGTINYEILTQIDPFATRIIS
ncbi:MAG: alanine racemase [Deltaproteobacteria bacterium]|nr:alanine racemase [Deltaproteobacteria bacterium]